MRYQVSRQRGFKAYQVNELIRETECNSVLIIYSDQLEVFTLTTCAAVKQVCVLVLIDWSKLTLVFSVHNVDLQEEIKIQILSQKSCRYQKSKENATSWNFEVELNFLKFFNNTSLNQFIGVSAQSVSKEFYIEFNYLILTTILKFQEKTVTQGIRDQKSSPLFALR